MSFVDDPSCLSDRQTALAKLAEIAAVGRLNRKMRKAAGLAELPSKAALSLDDVMQSLQGAGSQISEAFSPYLERAQPYAEQAMQFAKDRPEISMPLAGAGLGALVGGGSSLLGRKKRKNVLGNMLTGGLAGAGVGLGGAALAKAIPGLQQHSQSISPAAKPAPAPVPAGPVTVPAGESPAAKLQELESAAAPSIEKGVHSGINFVPEMIRKHPIMTAIMGGHAGVLGHGALQNSARMDSRNPLISLNENEFLRGLDRASGQLAGGGEAAARLKARGVTEELVNSLQNAGKGRGTPGAPLSLKDLLLRATGGQTSQLPVPKMQTSEMAKKLDELKKLLGGLGNQKLDDRIVQGQGRVATELDRVENLLSQMQAHTSQRDQAAQAVDHLRQMLAKVDVDANPELAADLQRQMGLAEKTLKATGKAPSSYDRLYERLTKMFDNNNELLNEVTKLRQGGGIDPANANKLQEFLTQAPNHFRDTMDVAPNQLGAISHLGRPIEHPTAAWMGKSYGPEALARAGYRLDRAGNPVEASGLMNRLRRFMASSRLPVYGKLPASARLGLHASPYAAMMIGPAIYDMYQQGAQQKERVQDLLAQLQPQG